jgi:transposase InsO family protein
MSSLYEWLRLSKQSVSAKLQRQARKALEAEALLRQASALRKQHPGAGCRKLSHQLKQQGWGRDKLEALLLSNGYRVQYAPKGWKTTHSIRLHRYKNLIKGIKIRDINRVVQTDITYYQVNGKYYYMVFIIDVYSKRIAGYNVSPNMEAKSNRQALEQLIALRSQASLKGLIHHSDRGSQYHSKAYVERLQTCGIKISMCIESWENAYAERVNRTIKEEYLDYWKIENFEQLKRCVDRAVKHHNEQRPHWNLGLKTPVQFEQQLKTIPMAKRKTIVLYKKDDKASYPPTKQETQLKNSVSKINNKKQL